jgi:hypothetical protein
MDLSEIRVNSNHAQTLAERLHDGQLDRDGVPLIGHVRRVADAVPRRARVVAWLHETLEHTTISEQALLTEGLSDEQLGAIRLVAAVHARAAHSGARMTSEDDPATPTTQSEVRAQRLGSALRGLAAELVDERRKVAQLRREIADLKARLEALESARPGPRDSEGPPANDP